MMFPKEKDKKRKEKKKTLTKLKEELWELCKRIIRAKYPNVCYTCGKEGLVGSDWQTGHGKPNGALQLWFKFDLRNLRPQCIHCNKNLGGCTDIFIAKLEREKEGLRFLDDACIKTDGRWEIKRFPPMGATESYSFVLNLIEEYKKILASYE